MSWVTLIWAAIVGACVTMALPHLLIALKQRSRVNLMFVLAALSVAGVAFGELTMMHSQTVEQIGRALQWSHLFVFFLVLAVTGFVHLYFRSGRLWLGLAACLARLVAVIVNFALPPNVNYRVITGLRPLRFLGEWVALPEG